MMSFAIHDYTSANRPWPVRMIVPFQRILLRILRPALDRLRDLLQNLHDRQGEQTEATANVARQLAIVENTSAQALAASRHHHTQTDQLAEVLTTVRQQHAHADHQQRDALQQQRDALQQLTQSHRALMQDHLALSRRIVMLENLLLQATAPEATDETLLDRPQVAPFRSTADTRAEAG